MRNDLLDAQAAIDWAVAQIPILEQRIGAWWSLPPYRLVHDPHPESGKVFLVLHDVKPIPAIINAEVGAIINSLRSSLDLTATSVGKRDTVLRSDQMYFPIAASSADFTMGNYNGHELIKQLSADHADVFKKLKPYRGGNDALVALHELDIMRKHRRLIGVRFLPTAVILTDGLRAAGFDMPNVWPGFQDEAVIGWHAFGAHQGQMIMPINVCFDEGALGAVQPVLPALSELASQAQGVVNAFDF